MIPDRVILTRQGEWSVAVELLGGGSLRSFAGPS
jgi:hypothetical protein